jgi:membrane-bound lytic murein transglycosylase D
MFLIQTLGSALFYLKFKTMLKKVPVKHIYAAIVCLFVTTTYAAEIQKAVKDSCPAGTIDSAGINTEKFSAVKFDKASPKIKLNKFASGFVKKYLKENSTGLVKIKGRSNSYFKTIDEVFIRYEIPVELKYLAVIESKLNSKALSHAGARGAWQLMPGTAKTLGLVVKGKNDERTHKYKSTVAAAKYLKVLHEDLGDWLLVIAAYNSGPGYVNKAIKKAGSRDFWRFQYFLPKETTNHVKRFISVHYYFEGEGSETTVSKAEWTKYQKEMAAFTARQNETQEQSLITANAIAVKELK